MKTRLLTLVALVGLTLSLATAALAAPRRQPCGRTLARMTSVEPAEEDV